ncbi:MAG: PQQ-binding-like beta-propeller repeat protein [Candidatus Micrarchaeota archaeon]|nr:PQQ-binding-like beta-propeller repeat protein [Candidatus Micrarchaeota archaeon]
MAFKPERTTVFLLAIFLIFTTATVAAQSSESSSNAEWRTFRRFLNQTGYTDSNAPTTANLNWSYYTGLNIVTSSATIANGVVYIGSVDNSGNNWPLLDSHVYAFNASNGNVIWNHDVAGGYEPGSVSIADGIAYVNAKNMFALNASDGSVIWTYSTGHDNGFSYDPMVYNGVVYSDSAWGDGKVYAVNASTGHLIWNHSIGNGVYSSPAIANGMVYSGNEAGHVYALDALTGNQNWDYFTGDSNEILSCPAVANGVVYISSLDGSVGNVYAINALTGDLIWSYGYNTGGEVEYSAPAVANGIVYVGSADNKVYALSTSTGHQIWNFTGGSGFGSSPAVANGIVFIGSWDNNVYALNASTGVQVWNYPTGDWIGSSPAVANGMVFIGSNDGYFYAFGSPAGSWNGGGGNASSNASKNYTVCSSGCNYSTVSDCLNGINNTVGSQCHLTEGNSTHSLTPGTYNITPNDWTGVIVVDGHNVTIDCNGAQFIGNGGDNYGVMVSSQSYTTIRNCIFRNYGEGVHLEDANSSQVLNNVFNSAGVGIRLISGYDNVFSTNTINVDNNVSLSIPSTENNTISSMTIGSAVNYVVSRSGTAFGASNAYADMQWDLADVTIEGNLGSSLLLGNKFVSLNPAILPALDTQANVTIDAVLCSRFNLYHYSGFADNLATIVSSGTLVATESSIGGNCTDASVCRNVRCTGGTLSFEAEHFDSYGAGSDVPEYTGIAAVAALLLAAAGFIAVRKRA